MIKFFRHFRKILVEQNRVSKYLLYAIGEIILVVIGILIALQINNWNEARKNTIEEKQVLQSLYANLVDAQKQSQEFLNDENNLKSLIINVLDISKNRNTQPEYQISDSVFKFAVWDLQSDQPILNTYINLKNTNKLSTIQNAKINQKFTQLELNQFKLKSLIDDRLSVHQIRIDNILENDVNFIPLIKSNVDEIDISNETPTNYFNVLHNKRIRNLLGMKLTFTQDVIDLRKVLDNDIKELLSLIQQELKTK